MASYYVDEVLLGSQEVLEALDLTPQGVVLGLKGHHLLSRLLVLLREEGAHVGLHLLGE